ncbi:MAG: hypothetical protein Edafosvirus36_9 [Edafosvirus sp.]|uniref:Uncharacterized protein n=1 Tax=Edafosvirus sp. TaxID=2487765 RepID=A0A3G4ZZN6_9VIRU|nr:MAG: hypothetical protein Edafosvirus36_9 [Edafosvirus sp.]
METNQNTWLNLKINDEYTKTIYNKTNLIYLKCGNMSGDEFHKYYKLDDSDMKSRDTTSINIINNIYQFQELYENEKLCDDQELKYLDSIMERYYGVEYKGRKVRVDVLIPPGTNRFHTNYLFKKIVDCSNDRMSYYIPKIIDGKIVEENNEKLITSDFKEEFYKFCFENTN